MAKGLGFQLSYTYTCDPGLTATSKFVDVVQRINKTQVTYAAGGDHNPIECTGNTRVITVTGQTKPDYLPLKTGVAFATLTIDLEKDGQFFQRLTLREEIRLASITRK